MAFLIRNVTVTADGREIMPRPLGKAAEARPGEKVPSGVWIRSLCSQIATIWATFSSSVMRESRSSTRCATGKEAFL
jgi:hypothetical protein